MKMSEIQAAHPKWRVTPIAEYGDVNEMKYTIKSELMNELKAFAKRYQVLDFSAMNDLVAHYLLIKGWLYEATFKNEYHNRLLAVMGLLEGRDTFQVDEPVYMVVGIKNRNKGESTMFNRYLLVNAVPDYGCVFRDKATTFNDLAEAKAWVIPGYEVVKIIDGKLHEDATLNQGIVVSKFGSSDDIKGE